MPSTPEQSRARRYRNIEKSREGERRSYRKHREKRLALKRKLISEKKQFISRIKSERGCQQCGIKDSRVLDFHHRDPSEKVECLGRSVVRSYETILKEIEKCDVLCANCHRILHAEERGEANAATD